MIFLKYIKSKESFLKIQKTFLSQIEFFESIDKISVKCSQSFNPSICISLIACLQHLLHFMFSFFNNVLLLLDLVTHESHEKSIESFLKIGNNFKFDTIIPFDSITCLDHFALCPTVNNLRKYVTELRYSLRKLCPISVSLPSLSILLSLSC